MLEYFEWSMPTDVVFGKGTVNKLGKKLKGLGKKCLLVTGRTSAEKHGYLKKAADQLDSVGIKYVHFNNISPNPKTIEIDAAADIAKTEKCDLVLALGGGSVMDASKAIAMLAKNEGGVWDYIYQGPGKKFKRFNTALPIVMVPTFAATGSELNSGAVISNPETKEKTVIFGEALYPKLTIIDPELTASVPYAATVDGAVDIICHVLEMYLSSDQDDFLQDQLSLAITRTVKRSLDILKDDLQNYEARAQMFWASSLALSGITTQGRSGGFPMHDIEHVLSGRCDKLAHGRGLATIFLKILEYDKEVASEKIVALTRYVFDDQYKNVDEAIRTWTKWFKEHQTGGSLKEFAGKEDPGKLAEQVLKFSGISGQLSNIKTFNKQELTAFIKELSE